MHIKERLKKGFNFVYYIPKIDKHGLICEKKT